jgi:thioredoxin reductase (NADPH)
MNGPENIPMPDGALETDVIIIGAGPAGLFAVFECGMLKMKCHVVDALEIQGGQCAALYPEKPIFDIPAWPKITGQDLIARLMEQAEPFEPVFHLGQQVETLTEISDGRLCLCTSNGTTIYARAVMIAGGAGAFGPNRPPIDGLAAFEGTSIFYLVARRDAFKGKRVAIAGGGDSAVDWALSLSDVAEHVYVIHRRDKFRAAPESVERMRALQSGGKVELVIPYQLSGLEGEGGQLSAVMVRAMDGNERKLDADILLPFFGLAADLGPIAQWGLDINHHQITADPATMETTRPGIFAIGDIATYPGKLKLILTGFSEAALAAHAAFKRVHPDESLHFEYSTTKGLPED